MRAHGVFSIDGISTLSDIMTFRMFLHFLIVSCHITEQGRGGGMYVSVLPKNLVNIVNITHSEFQTNGCFGVTGELTLWYHANARTVQRNPERFQKWKIAWQSYSDIKRLKTSPLLMNSVRK